ncbi:MAG: hypothetical protein IJD92_03150 [Bacilli bacterium]|nr:hypothetical protein [Bacilli bacterium]
MKDTIKRQSMIIISIIGIVVVSLIMGLTYAYQSVNVTYSEGSDDDLTVKAGVLDVSFVASSRINETNLELMNDYTNAKYSEFTVTNNSSYYVSYYISLTDMTCSSALTSPDFKYTLTKVNGSKEDFIYTGDFSSLDCTQDYELMLDGSKYRTLSLNKSETLRLYLWLEETDEDQNILENTTFKGKIQINSTFTDSPFNEGTLAYKILNNSKNVTAEEIEKGYAVYSKDPKTLPAENISESDESTLSETPDDFTENTGNNSYYFRGNVNNNYVNFAGMCWRIVRIDGNSNIKLILEDQYTTCDDDETSETDTIKYTGAWDIEASDGTNITMDGSIPYRVGNFGYDDSSGKYKMSYLNPVDNKDRAMVNAFKYFQTNTLKNKINALHDGKNLSDYLVSGNWCLNDKAYSDEQGTTILENPDYSSSFYYDSYVRLYGKTTKEPTLKCPVETMETFADSTYMYVGTLTADEIVYAGGKMYETVVSNYLINNWQINNSKYFWLISPDGFNSAGDTAVDMSYYGVMNNFSVDLSDTIAFRPSVSLTSSVTVAPNGNGDITNPYVIE